MSKWVYLITAVAWVALLLYAVPDELFAGGAADRVTDRPSRLECGVYELRGQLRESESGVDYLELLPGTTNRFSVILRKLKPEISLANKDRLVAVEAEITQSRTEPEIRAEVRAFKGSVLKRQAMEEAMRLEKKSACR